jgi:hypothetical protein
VLAIRARHNLGIVSVVTAALALAAWPRKPHTQPAPGTAPAHPCAPFEPPACDSSRVSSIILQGRVITPESGAAHVLRFAELPAEYVARTQEDGTFELRVPRNALAVDPCALALRTHSARTFTDGGMTVSYRLLFEVTGPE